MAVESDISEVNDLLDRRSVQEYYHMRNPEDFLTPIETAGEELERKADDRKEKRESLQEFINRLVDIDGSFTQGKKVRIRDPDNLYSKQEIMTAFEETCMETWEIPQNASTELFQKLFPVNQGKSWYGIMNRGKRKGFQKVEMVKFVENVGKGRIKPLFKRECAADLAAGRAKTRAGRCEYWINELELPRWTEHPSGMETDQLRSYNQKVSERVRDLEDEIQEVQQNIHLDNTATYHDVMGTDEYPVLRGLLDVYSVVYAEDRKISELVYTIDQNNANPDTSEEQDQKLN